MEGGGKDVAVLGRVASETRARDSGTRVGAGVEAVVLVEVVVQKVHVVMIRLREQVGFHVASCHHHPQFPSVRLHVLLV